MKPNKVIATKNHRKFNETFKREALNNWLGSDKSATVVAEELGFSPGRLYAWKKRFAPAGASEAEAGAKRSTVAELQVELAAALRENHHLREQRDILKKTLGILSEPVRNVSNVSTR